jgi:hypothetical protein
VYILQSRYTTLLLLYCRLLLLSLPLLFHSWALTPPRSS